MKPMLAGTVTDISTLKFPLIASPKLDGIRVCIHPNGVGALTRNMKPIPNRYIAAALSDPAFEYLDGEIIVGDPTAENAFGVTTSAVMSRDREPDFTFWVFDSFREPELSYTYRQGEWLSSFYGLDETCEFIRFVDQIGVDSAEELSSLEDQWLDRGYEGVMLRDPNGKYKFGRSTLKEGALLKLKRFVDAEAEVIGWEEQQHNGNEATVNALGLTERSSHKANKTGKGTLGTLRVRDVETGVEFEIGTGFDDAQRRAIWNRRDHAGEHALLGQLVKYKSFPIGCKDKPRFPVFLGFRHSADMGQ